MAIGAVLEPLIIVSLLAGGTLVNRDQTRANPPSNSSSRRPDPWQDIEYAIGNDRSPERSTVEEKARNNRSRSSTASSSATVWHDVEDGKDSGFGTSPYRVRTLRFWKWACDVTSPNTEVHKDRFLSRVLRRFPFFVEVWYWALIYWVCIRSPLDMASAYT
jgi:hypothetical protein